MKLNLKKESIYHYRYLIAFLAIGLVYFFNMLIDIMDIDAAQYASIAREMWDTGNYLEVHQRGLDYLDKPPLLFWVSSLSIGLFGVSNFAYKFPVILIIILGIYSTYRFTLLYYDKKRAIYAALILATTQGMFLVTNDVRTDGILTAFVIFSVWQLSRFLRDLKIRYLFFGAIGVAAAMLSKGPIGIVLVAFALGGDLLLKRDWKAIFKWEWIFMLIIVALFLAPMTYGLYTQYDLHPEKEVYGLSGPSGVKFFYWTQSFGRITGDIYWKNDTSFFFFFHTILWDFQPWIFFLVPALFMRFKTLLLLKFRISENAEYMSFSVFVLGFLALSSSGFKLPHYIFPLFPFAAVFTADYIGSFTETKGYRRFARVQFGFSHLFFIVAFISFILFFTPSSFLLPFLMILLYGLFVYVFIKSKTISDKVILPTVTAIFAFGLMMGTYFYPNLLAYQAESIVGKEITKRQVPKDMFYSYRAHANCLDYYSDRIVQFIDAKEAAAMKKGTLVFTDREGMEKLTGSDDFGYKVDSVYNDYNVTGLSFDFLLKSTRESVVEKKYLLQKN